MSLIPSKRYDIFEVYYVDYFHAELNTNNFWCRSVCPFNYTCVSKQIPMITIHPDSSYLNIWNSVWFQAVLAIQNLLWESNSFFIRIRSISPNYWSNRMKQLQRTIRLLYSCKQFSQIVSLRKWFVSYWFQSKIHRKKSNHSLGSDEYLGKIIWHNSILNIRRKSLHKTFFSEWKEDFFLLYSRSNENWIGIFD